MSKVLNVVSIDLSNYASNSSLSNYALNSSLSTLNASNITSGTLSISRGGIGTTTLTQNQLLIGNTNTSILRRVSSKLRKVVSNIFILYISH